jgi:hypothetical protein
VAALSRHTGLPLRPIRGSSLVLRETRVPIHLLYAGDFDFR